MSQDDEPRGPFMRLFVDMWLDPESKINTLTCGQERAYFRLCLFQFRSKAGVLPGAPALLCSYARQEDYVRDVLPVLKTFFQAHENGWSHPRVRAEWDRMNAKSVAGARRAESRWGDAGSNAGSNAEYRRENVEEKKGQKNPSRAAAREVFAYWKASCKPAAVETDARLKVIEARLAEEPGSTEAKVAGLKRAVQGALVDPLFNGTEKGVRYWGFENIFKHGGRDRIEKLQGSAAQFTKRRIEPGKQGGGQVYTPEQAKVANAWRDEALAAMREGRPLPPRPR